MKAHTFFTFASAVFSIVAIVHLLRVITGFGLVIAGWSVPIWVNTVAFLIAAILGYHGLKLSRKTR
ncbi:MAG: hypothetical protein AAB534_00805 [Patescibacteria group bacterium]